MHFLIVIAVLMVLIGINAFYVAAEFALLSVPPVQLEALAEKEKWAARMYGNLTNTARQDHYIAVSQLGITLASLGLGMYSEHALAGIFMGWMQTLGILHTFAWAHWIATGAALVLLTYMHVVLGEMVPKSVAILSPMKTARIVELPMLVSGYVLAPLVWVLNGLGNIVLKILHLPISKDLSLVYSPEELSIVLEESNEGGLLEDERHDWCQHLLVLKDRTLHQVMMPRVKVTGIAVNTPVREALELVRSEGYSRYPLYDGDLDHITGIIHVRDMFKALNNGQYDDSVSSLKRDCPKFPESLSVDEALDAMRSGQAHMAVVVDEHGGVAGIVTLEDLLEDVFGEVFDEFDETEEMPIKPVNDHEWIVDGSVILEVLSEETDTELELTDIDSVSGLVMDLLKRLPEKGDTVEFSNLRFEVLEVADMVVSSCRVTKLPQEEQESQE